MIVSWKNLGGKDRREVRRPRRGEGAVGCGAKAPPQPGPRQPSAGKLARSSAGAAPSAPGAAPSPHRAGGGGGWALPASPLRPEATGPPRPSPLAAPRRAAPALPVTLVTVARPGTCRHFRRAAARSCQRARAAGTDPRAGACAHAQGGGGGG